MTQPQREGASYSGLYEKGEVEHINCGIALAPVTGQTKGSNQGSTPDSSVLSQIATGSTESTRVVRPRLFSPANPLQGGAGGVMWRLDYLSAWNGRTIYHREYNYKMAQPTQRAPAILDYMKKVKSNISNALPLQL